MANVWCFTKTLTSLNRPLTKLKWHNVRSWPRSMSVLGTGQSLISTMTSFTHVRCFISLLQRLEKRIRLLGAEKGYQGSLLQYPANQCYQLMSLHHSEMKQPKWAEQMMIEIRDRLVPEALVLLGQLSVLCHLSFVKGDLRMVNGFVKHPTFNITVLWDLRPCVLKSQFCNTNSVSLV